MSLEYTDLEPAIGYVLATYSGIYYLSDLTKRVEEVISPELSGSDFNNLQNRVLICLNDKFSKKYQIDISRTGITRKPKIYYQIRITQEFSIPADSEVGASIVAESIVAEYQSRQYPSDATNCRAGYKVLDKDGNVLLGGGSV